MTVGCGELIDWHLAKPVGLLIIITNRIILNNYYEYYIYSKLLKMQKYDQNYSKKMQMTKSYSKIIRMTKKYSKFKPTISDKAHLELLGKF